MAGVEGFRKTYSSFSLQDEFVPATKKRKDILDRLRQVGVLVIDALEAADKIRSGIILGMVQQVTTFSDLDSPKVMTLCRARIHG